MQIIKVIFLFLLFPFQVLYGSNFRPWTERDLEFYPRFDYLFEHYAKVHSTSGSEKREADDHFFIGGISGSYAEYSAEAELILADTRHRSFGFDSFRITGRYQWMSDIIGDPLSVITGFSYIVCSETALHDMSSFHHGRNAVEMHISIGKESTCWDTWSSRWWTSALFGVADHGSPWWRGIAAWEKKMWEAYIFEIFVRGLVGTGRNSLDLSDSFSGYGSIRHRSVEVGAGVTKSTECGGIWKAMYAHRVFAYNYPSSAVLIKISYIYPFGL